jgi:hypothetical protein
MMLNRGRVGGAMTVATGGEGATAGVLAGFFVCGDACGVLGRGTGVGRLASSSTPTGASGTPLEVEAVDDDSGGASAAATVNDSGSAAGPSVGSESDSSRTLGATAPDRLMSPLDATRLVGVRSRAAPYERPSTCVARKPSAASPTIPAAASVS